MWGIVENGRSEFRGIHPEDFESRFTQICAEHRRDGSAYAFAFLLLDERHPHVIKVVTDPAYWAALDAISGANLTVFSFFVPPPVIDGDAYLDLPTPAGRDISRGVRGLELISALLELGEPLSLPAVLFFQVSGDRVIDFYHAEITDDGVESAFNDIRQLFEAVAYATRRIRPENRGNDREIFNLVKAEVGSRSRSLKVKKRLRDGAPALGVVGFVQTLFGIPAT